MKILSLQTTSIFVIGRHEPCVKYGFSLDEKKGEKKYPHRTWSCHVGPVGLVSCFSKMNRSKRCECRAFLSTWNEANRMQFTCVLNKHLVFPAQNRRVFYYSIHKDLSMRTTFNGLPGLTHKTASHSYERILSRVPMIITSYKIYDWRKPTIFKKKLPDWTQDSNPSGPQPCNRHLPLEIPYWVTDSDAVVLWLARGERQLCDYWDWSEIPRCPQYDSIQSNSTKTGWRVCQGSFLLNPLTCLVFNQCMGARPTNPGQLSKLCLCPMIGMVMSRPILSRCVHWWLAISCWLWTNSKTYVFIVLIHMSICAYVHSRIRHWDIRLRDFLVVPSNIAPPNGSKQVSTLTFLWVFVNF